MPLPPVVSRAVVGVYARAYNVAMHEAQLPHGADTYPSFDAFFTRGLQAGARSHDVPADVLVSPADGRLDEQGSIDDDGRITVKGRPYRTIDLLGDRDELARYRGGHFNVIYLSPRDYHRVHAPCAGTLCQVRSYPGELFPVNSVSEHHIPQFLARNRRVVLAIDSPTFGRVSMVMVAAMIVGRVTVSGIAQRDVPIGTHAMRRELATGDEVAMFHLGSTVVMFCEARVPRLDRALGPILMGAPLWPPQSDHAAPPKPTDSDEGAARNERLPNE